MAREHLVDSDVAQHRAVERPKPLLLLHRCPLRVDRGDVVHALGTRIEGTRRVHARRRERAAPDRGLLYAHLDRFGDRHEVFLPDERACLLDAGIGGRHHLLGGGVVEGQTMEQLRDRDLFVARDLIESSLVPGEVLGAGLSHVFHRSLDAFTDEQQTMVPFGTERELRNRARELFLLQPTEEPGDRRLGGLPRRVHLAGEPGPGRERLRFSEVGGQPSPDREGQLDERAR